MSTERPISFDEAIRELEKIAARLEAGDLPLEQSLELFERGTALTRHCQSLLDNAERRVETILRSRGEVGVAPYTADSASSPQKPGSRNAGELRNNAKEDGDSDEEEDDLLWDDEDDEDDEDEDDAPF